jgi:hypothetical protein
MRNLLILLLLCLFPLTLWSQDSQTPVEAAEMLIPGFVPDETLELTEYNYEPGEILELKGNWKMIPGEIVAPNSKLWKDDYIVFTVPGFWNDQQAEVLRDRAMATFQTTVFLPEARQNYGLYVKDVNTSYRLFVGNYLLKEMGHFSQDLQESRGVLMPILLSTMAGGAVKITLQIVNGEDNFGGIKEAPDWGEYPVIQEKVQNNWAWDSFFAGGFVLLGLFHFIQYLLNTQQDNNLFIGLTSFLMGIRTLQLGERILSHWFTPLGFDILIKFEFLIIYPLVLTLCFYCVPYSVRPLNR